MELHCHTAAFQGSPPTRSPKSLGDSKHLLIPHEAPGFTLANGKVCSSFFCLGCLCTAVEPHDNVPAQSRCHQQACNVFILSTFSLKTADLYPLDFSNCMVSALKMRHTYNEVGPQRNLVTQIVQKNYHDIPFLNIAKY